MKGLLPTDPGHDKLALAVDGWSLEGPDPGGHSTRDEQIRPVMIVAWGLGLAGWVKLDHPRSASVPKRGACIQTAW